MKILQRRFFFQKLLKKIGKKIPIGFYLYVYVGSEHFMWIIMIKLLFNTTARWKLRCIFIEIEYIDRHNRKFRCGDFTRYCIIWLIIIKVISTINNHWSLWNTLMDIMILYLLVPIFFSCHPIHVKYGDVVDSFHTWSIYNKQPVIDWYASKHFQSDIIAFPMNFLDIFHSYIHPAICSYTYIENVIESIQNEK